MLGGDKYMSEKYDKIVERSKGVIGERYTTEIIGIAQKLLPQIEEAIKKSDKGTHIISMKDMMSYIPKFESYHPSLESIFCILSSVLWPHHISADISYDAEDFCLYLIFSKPSPRDDEPSIKNCADKWMYIYEEL